MFMHIYIYIYLSLSLAIFLSLSLSVDITPIIDCFSLAQYPRSRVQGGLDDRFCPASSISYGVKITDCT